MKKSNTEFKEKDYSKSDVKTALFKMQHYKCCYCETEINDNSGSEVDHHIPRSAGQFKNENGTKKWHLINEWKNLLYSCQKCNSRKSDKSPFEHGKRVIIDPSDGGIDPEEHIGFIMDGEFTFGYDTKGKTLLGRNTIQRLKFDERYLEFQRKFRVVYMEIHSHLLELYDAIQINNTHVRDEYQNKLTIATSAHQKFTAFKRAAIRYLLLDLNKKLGQTIQIDILKGSEVKTS